VTAAYVESSAVVKLAINEPEGSALRLALREHDDVVTSELSVVEVGRAARRDDGDAGLARARAALLGLASVAIDRPILDRAAMLEPTALGSLDAIHVATALALEERDVVFYSYDRRTLDAAEANGLTVASPGV
jgi:predicted nucleic acid-binding protein